jgi:hypothetical protein
LKASLDLIPKWLTKASLESLDIAGNVDELRNTEAPLNAEGFRFFYDARRCLMNFSVSNVFLKSAAILPACRSLPYILLLASDLPCSRGREVTVAIMPLQIIIGTRLDEEKENNLGEEKEYASLKRDEHQNFLSKSENSRSDFVTEFGIFFMLVRKRTPRGGENVPGTPYKSAERRHHGLSKVFSCHRIVIPRRVQKSITPSLVQHQHAVYNPSQVLEQSELKKFRMVTTRCCIACPDGVYLSQIVLQIDVVGWVELTEKKQWPEQIRIRSRSRNHPTKNPATLTFLATTIHNVHGELLVPTFS